MTATQWSRLRIGSCAVVACLVLAGCTGAETGRPEESPAPISPGVSCAPHPVDELHPTGVSCTNFGAVRSSFVPLFEGHVECPKAMSEQYPGTRCVAPEYAQRLGAACSAHGATCVLAGGGLFSADGIVECPVVHSAPGSTDPTMTYTPPCVRKSIGGGAYYIYDGNGVLIGGGTP